MGQFVKLSTSRIFDAYLALGMLEINSGNGLLTQKQIIENLNNGETHADNYFGKYLLDGNIIAWLEDEKLGIGLNKNEISQLIERKPKGYQLKNDLPKEAYEDYLGCMLHLCTINDRRHTEYLKELLNKEGEKPLSIITKLVLAKRKCDNTKIDWKDKEKVRFEPKTFLLDKDEWKVEGDITIDSKESRQKIKLSDIKQVHYKL